MAVVTIANLTSEVVLLQELYINLKPLEVFTVTREKDQLHAMPALQQLWKDGTIEVTVTPDAAEADFIAAKLHADADYTGLALETATRTYHQPTITPETNTNAPGQQPDLGLIGSTLVAEFTLNTDSAYRIFKIPASYVSDAAFHVHWTKESGVAGDSDQSFNAARWRISYTVFPGGSNADINVAPTVLEESSTYIDSGTTTRIVYRTSDIPAAGFVAGYYVGICVESITSESDLTCEAAMVSVDLTFTEYINQ
jgi:hypothetical protein